MPQPALVIGTLSYQYVEAVGRQVWVVRLARLDSPAASQDYALKVESDPAGGRGLFSGALPPGVYAVADVTRNDRHFDVSGMPVPFEVQAGEVRDLGHYAVNPLPER